jgi:hypothetical protein
MNKLFQFSHKSVVRVYQWVAVLTLYGVLACVLSYGFTMAFYAVNTSWVAPFIVTPTNDKILELTARIVTSEQALSTLTLDRDRLEGSLGQLKVTKAALDTLAMQFQQAISMEKRGNSSDQPELSDLSLRKRVDNAQTGEMMKEITTVEQQIDKDLLAGLITQGDAAMVKTQLRQSRNSATDDLIGEVLLRGTVRQKQPELTSTVDNLAKEAELRGNIVLLDIQIRSGEEQLSSDKAQIAQLNGAVGTAKNSPYYLATQGKVKFAFVPYDNQGAVREGATVYDCYLNMIICRQVGAVTQIFKDEERATHPVFKSDVRGVLIQLGLTDADAAKDKVLFVGRKPFFI